MYTIKLSLLVKGLSVNCYLADKFVCSFSIDFVSCLLPLIQDSFALFLNIFKAIF
jgi:hypothetical protein